MNTFEQGKHMQYLDEALYSGKPDKIRFTITRFTAVKVTRWMHPMYLCIYWFYLKPYLNAK